MGLLLLIACVNAANLLLARSSARVREIAVRSALGAARGRIVRQLVTESLAIALAAGALGTVFAVGGVRVLVACLPAGFPRAAEIRLDAGVFAVTLLVAVVTGLLFGLVPAVTAARSDLQQGLREGGRGATGGGRQLRLRNFLVVGETGLACVLLIAAGLMLHSFVNLLQADAGFRPQQVLTATISLPNQSYREGCRFGRFHDQLMAGLRSIPGVQFAGLGTDLPWTGYDENTGGFTVEGRPAEYNNKTTARYHAASPDYFRAMGIPLLSGRFLTERDDKDAREGHCGERDDGEALLAGRGCGGKADFLQRQAGGEGLAADCGSGGRRQGPAGQPGRAARVLVADGAGAVSRHVGGGALELGSRRSLRDRCGWWCGRSTRGWRSRICG